MKKPYFVFPIAALFAACEKEQKTTGNGFSYSGSLLVFDTISFTPDQTGTLTKWTFGDGDSSIATATQHIYKTAGSFTVTMYQGQDTVQKTLQISAAPSRYTGSYNFGRIKSIYNGTLVSRDSLSDTLIVIGDVNDSTVTWGNTTLQLLSHLNTYKQIIFYSNNGNSQQYLFVYSTDNLEGFYKEGGLQVYHTIQYYIR